MAEGIVFPNGMAITPDNLTLIVAESYGKKLTAFEIAADGSLSRPRVWADLGDGVPDGICLDREGSDLVRGRSQQAMRARPRRGRGAADDPAGPRLLFLHARGHKQDNTVHARLS